VPMTVDPKDTGQSQSAGARRARPVHPMLSEQTNDVTPSGRPSAESTGAGDSLEQTKQGSALGKQAWGRKSYAEVTKGKLPFQKPYFFNTLEKINCYPS
jgi:hypothetical protein